jgi:Na+/pantothenate symporter
VFYRTATQQLYHVAVVGVVVFVFGYTGFGGAFAHAYTNGMQALIMLVVSTLVFMSGLSYWFDGSVVATLADDGWTAPGSVLFSTPLEVWGVPFLMGAALSTQPHLLTKALYVDGRRDLALTVGVGLGAFTVFQLMLFAGTYALLALPEPVPQDQVVAQYLVVAFESQPLLGAFCTVAILSASMSTLDGLLVAIAASVGNDLLPAGTGVWTQRGVLATLAAITIAIAWSPPSLVLVLGQAGVYGLVAASAGPLVVGLMREGPLPASVALASALVALAVHLGIYLGGLVVNPGLSASAALLVGVAISWFGTEMVRNPAAESPQMS